MEREPHIVVIEVKDKGQIDYKNGLVRIYPEDTIVWQCPRCKEAEKPFSVHIGWNSPFEKCSYQSSDGSDITVNVPAEARSDYFRYMVAVLVDGKIYTDDPELIVKRPGE